MVHGSTTCLFQMGGVLSCSNEVESRQRRAGPWANGGLRPEAAVPLKLGIKAPELVVFLMNLDEIVG